MSDTEPIALYPRFPRLPGSEAGSAGQQAQPGLTFFNRRELSQILAVYGRMVAAGEARDYALDFGETAVFSIFRRTSEVPLYRVVKNPRLQRKQGAYSLVAAGGLIMKRGHDLARILEALDLKLVRMAER